ncbi:hypothetical protein EV702DRAFT_1049465 [Suillus placidus]|uniref:Uncharacterized protein n=1 Tax=Suillus placidus TaxID=48579 RepID=A0A9P6ZLF0_9AGAM|nr:hypothetical protein EV702DRAFT_1049465 [Suillus placidus]
MGGSKVQEWTPTSNISVVEWKKTFQSRKVTGKWVERPKIHKIHSVTATPTKSPMKQPSQDMLYHGGEDYFGDLDQQIIIPLQLPKSLLSTSSNIWCPVHRSACFKSQNDYLRQWVPRTKEYLNILLEQEAPACRSCIICGTDGGFFKESCLVKTGLVISLGHNGNPCPCQDYEGDDIDLFADTDTDRAPSVTNSVLYGPPDLHHIPYKTGQRTMGPCCMDQGNMIIHGDGWAHQGNM